MCTYNKNCTIPIHTRTLDRNSLLLLLLLFFSVFSTNECCTITRQKKSSNDRNRHFDCSVHLFGSTLSTVSVYYMPSIKNLNIIYVKETHIGQTLARNTTSLRLRAKKVPASTEFNTCYFH